MAIITVTTDQGELMNRWEDSADQIGNVNQTMNRMDLMNDIAQSVDVARQRDNRNSNGTQLSPRRSAKRS